MENDREKNEKTPQTLTESQDETKEDAAAIDKGVRFWTHPSLLQVSADEKMQYLRSRGLSEDEIHRVWEKVVDNTNQQTVASPQPLHQPEQPRSVPVTSPTPYNPPPTYHEAPQHNYDSESAYDIPVLLTIGGVLGLTAAAAVRWLNGGDFCLLPPPTRQGDTNEATRILEQSRNIEICTGEEEEGTATEDEEVIVSPADDDNNGMQEVIRVLETYCSQQERILQQLSNFKTKQVTDQSMNLLRNSGTSREALIKQLTEIKAELTTIVAVISQPETTTNGKSWEKRLEESLLQLRECMRRLQQDTTGPVSSDAVVHVESTSAFKSPVVRKQEPSPGKALSLREAIRTLAEENESSQLREGAQLIYLYVINLSSHPHVPRYRKIFTSNESFQKVEQLVGGKKLLLALGFVEKPNCLEWEGGESEEEMTYLKEAAAALSILKSSASPSDVLARNALSVMRPSTPPLQQPDSTSLLQTPHFIASPPVTKKHPFLTEPDACGDDPGLLDISNISEHFESRLETLAQSTLDDMRMFDALDSNGDSLDSVPKTNLSMRKSSDELEGEE